jgi:hypothetical protein
MDIAAVCELQARAREAIASAEKYRAVATDEDFYHALAVTYERAAREMQLMLDAVERAFAGAAVQEAA